MTARQVLRLAGSATRDALRATIHPDQRSDLARQWFLRVAQVFTPVVLADVGGNRLLVSTSDYIVSSEAFRLGTFDERQIERIRELLDGAAIGKVVLEVGANIGTSSVELVRRFGARQVVAFEPDPQNFELLSLNVVLNGMQGVIHPYQLAISDSDGSVSLARSRRNWGGHQVVPVGARTDRETVAVQARTLDSLVDDGTIPVDDLGLVWMDVEGHEAAALAGAERLLERHVPFVVEYSPDKLDLDRFEQVVRRSFSEIVNLGNAEAPVATPIRRLTSDDVGSLRRERGSVDLLLLP